MILLTNTNETLELETGGMETVEWTTHYADHSTQAFTPGSDEGTVSSATTTTIVSAPASGEQRQVKFITVKNTDATNPVDVTIKKDVASTEYRLTETISLAAGSVLYYIEGAGFSVSS